MVLFDVSTEVPWFEYFVESFYDLRQVTVSNKFGFDVPQSGDDGTAYAVDAEAVDRLLAR